MAKVITLFNQSGGVGKSTLTMNLGYHLAQREQRILLVDMDPQASLTVFMGLLIAQLQETVADAILQESPLPIQHLKGDWDRVDIAPTNINLSAADMRLVQEVAREFRLKESLEPHLEKYDFILVDAPPSLGILSVLAMVAADWLLVPIQTQYKAYMGTDLLLQSVSKVKQKVNRKLEIVGVVPTMYDSRNSMDGETLDSIKEQLAKIAKIYPPIPRATAFADASALHRPFALCTSKKHPAIAVLNEIASDLLKKVNG